MASLPPRGHLRRLETLPVVTVGGEEMLLVSGGWRQGVAISATHRLDLQGKIILSESQRQLVLEGGMNPIREWGRPF